MKTEFDKQKGNEIQIPCSGACNGKTYHQILTSVDRSGREAMGQDYFYWDKTSQIVECQGCKEISFRTVSSNSEDMDYGLDDDGEPELYHAEHESLYPPRIQDFKGLGQKIYLLPIEIQGIYSETIAALENDLAVLAGIGLRALLESVCKNQQCAGRNLKLKIDDLVIKQILTQRDADILHKIRTLGNNAAHEVKPHDAKQLAIGMDIIEHLFKTAYILPVQAKSFG